MVMRLLALLVAALLALPAVAQQQQQRPAQAQQPGPQFTIKNDGEVTLQELYVARAGQGSRAWGPDRLGTEVVPAGGTFRVRLPSGFGCSVDIRIVYEDGEEEVRERQDVCRTREVAFARTLPVQVQEREVAIQNRSPRTIQNLYISGAQETEWGEDRLGSAVIAPGDSFTARFPDSGCSYDVRVVFDNGGAEERRAIDLCATTALAIAPGWTTAETIGGDAAAVAAGQVSIVNRSGRTVFEIYVFADGSPNRGADRLGADTLDNGRAIAVPQASPPACASTLAITYDDGTREQRAGIDWCATSEIVIAAGWTGADPPAAGGGAATPGGSSPGTIGIVNRSGRTVMELYSFPDGAASEGPDRLGTDVMRAGGSIRVPAARAPSCGTTLRVIYDNGEREERAGLDFCRLTELAIEAGWTSAPVAGAARIVNAGSAPIIALHADAPGAPRGPDRLGDAIIGVGEGFSLSPPQDGVCAYDVTAVFRDRRTARIAGADLCAGAEIRIAP
jgi:hypothetical protein